MGFEAMLSAAFMSPHYIMIESPVPFIELFSPNKTLTAGLKVGFGTTAHAPMITSCSALFSAPKRSCEMFRIRAVALNYASIQSQKFTVFIQFLDPTPISSYFKSSSYFVELGNIPEHMKERTEHKQL